MFKNFSCVNCAKEEEEPESHPLDQSTGAVGQEEDDDLYADLEGPDDQMLKEQEKTQDRGQTDVEEEEEEEEIQPTEVLDTEDQEAFKRRLTHEGFPVQKFPRATFSRSSGPKPVTLTCDEGFQTLYWCKKGQRKENGKSVKVSEISGILRAGDPDPYDPEFFGTKIIRKNLQWEQRNQCMAIIWPGRGSLDLLCEDDAACDELVTGMRNLIGVMGPPSHVAS